MTIDIENLTVREVREIAQLADYPSKLSPSTGPQAALPFKVGDAILIRTVTMIQVGRVRAIGRDFFTLEDGGWVADTGRFSTMLETGSIGEFERAPGPWFLVGRGAVVDIFPWAHKLPEKTK